MNTYEAINYIIDNLNDMKKRDREHYLKLKNMIICHDKEINESIQNIRREIQEVQYELKSLKDDLNNKF